MFSPDADFSYLKPYLMDAEKPKRLLIDLKDRLERSPVYGAAEKAEALDDIIWRLEAWQNSRP